MENILHDNSSNQIDSDFNVHWYPGHMSKTKRLLNESISLVEIVIELLDARIPFSSKNPNIDELAKNKHRIIVLNKIDLANEKVTSQWKDYYTSLGFKVVLCSCTKNKGIDDIIAVSRDILKPKIDALKLRGRINYTIRAMIVGVPNVGKSTLINKYAGRTAAKVADKAGVTRQTQWIKMKNNFELLDTPGILWPKFDDNNVGLNLAFTGAINDSIIDMTTLAYSFLNRVKTLSPQTLKDRYKIEFDEGNNCVEILDKIAIARGFLLKGDRLNLERASITVIDEFRGAKLGNISLEKPQVL